jgi:manganese/iron transport system permease protein
VHDLLIDPYTLGFMQRALIAAVLSGLVAPLVGTWVVLRRLAYLGDAMGHGTIAGVAVAYLLGVSIVFGALAAAILMAALLGLLVAHPRIRSDSAIAGAEVALFAGGVLILAQTGGSRVDLTHILFGSILTVSTSDLQVNAVLASVIVLVLLVIGRDLRDATFDPINARLVGIRVNVVQALLLVLIGGVVVAALQTIGLLMTIAMLVLPAAAARLWTRTVLQMSLLGSVFGTVAAVAGLTIAYHGALPSGAVIAGMACLILGVSAILTIGRRRRTPASHLDQLDRAFAPPLP